MNKMRNARELAWLLFAAVVLLGCLHPAAAVLGLLSKLVYLGFTFGWNQGF